MLELTLIELFFTPAGQLTLSPPDTQLEQLHFQEQQAEQLEQVIAEYTESNRVPAAAVLQDIQRHVNQRSPGLHRETD